MRSKIFGTAERPRLTVSKSLRNTTAQLIDDQARRTIVYYSTINLNVGASGSAQTKRDAAGAVGEKIAALAKEKGVTEVVFDRNQYRYHGRLQSLAEGARKGGLKF